MPELYRNYTNTPRCRPAAARDFEACSARHETRSARARMFSGAEVPRAGGAVSPLGAAGVLVAWARGGYPGAVGRGEEGFEGRAAMGYDHGYDAEEVFYPGLALYERYVEGFVEGCLERIGEDDPDEEANSRG